ncbi:BMP family ABC transporter substrate-binding protein [Mycoplasma zalophi]|uniref:BMP family ABC transporter substrate-binding protein n=1 Tax=Mycoplasma zalophi TaxID=191287 RepID=UPI0021C97932|nr:BMP family ABC transporter substrate-binding protein [Mycoplasma zalophi]MCU4116890.1 BMP family ABC transporter substrate-binding protein [Mycoplasma zalophi]
MKKSKKLLFSFAALGVVTTMIAVPTLAASCTSGNTNAKTTDETKKQITISNIKHSTNVNVTDEAKANKAIVITDAGHIDDLSFNQSAYEGIKAIIEDLGLSNDTPSIEPNSESQYEQIYTNILNTGFKYWITVGFKHDTAIKKFYNLHKEEMQKKGVVIIAVDYDASTPISDTEPGIPTGYSISLQYNTKESGWVAGYASAKFLSTLPEDKRWVASFGGGNFPGVTDFNEGFLKGIKVWNDENPTAKVKHQEDSQENKVNLNTGFVVGNKMNPIVQNILNGGSSQKVPTIILPVAGPATTVVVDNLKDDQYVIGVDVDQTNVVSTRKDHFFTSITKGIGQSVYDVLEGLYSNNSAKLHGFVLGQSNGHNVGNIAQNWTGVSKANLETTEKTTKAQADLDAAMAKFQGLSEAKKAYVNSLKAEENGAEINNGQERLNKLVEIVNA